MKHSAAGRWVFIASKPESAERYVKAVVGIVDESECSELREVLEEWVLYRVHRNLPLPSIDGIELIITEVA